VWEAVSARRNRKVLLGVLAAVLALVVAGIAVSSTNDPPRTEAVVQFDPDVTVVQETAVRTACPSVGKAVQEPRGDQSIASNRRFPLRYDFTEASASDKAAIYRCIGGRPGVVGMSEYRQSG
jgi:hypothetical protein